MSTVTTGRVRFSFMNVFTPRAPQEPGEQPKYSVTLLIPKSDYATIQAIQQAIEVAVQEGITTTFGGSRPPRLNLPLYDGDGVRPSSGEPFGEECKGHFVMSASSLQQPSVVDVNVQPILNQAEIYSGCFGRASLRFFAYNKNGNKGVGCGLGNIQKLSDGDPLTGRTTAADDFGGANSYGQNQATQFKPQSYQAPVQSPAGYGAPQQPATQYQDPAWYTQGGAMQHPAAYGNQQQPATNNYQAPPYQQPNGVYGAPVQQPAQQYQAQYSQPINPVTGLPMTGGVMGI